MKTKRKILNVVRLGWGLVAGLALATGCTTDSGRSDDMKPMKGAEHQQMLNK
ncbi:MAG TPA: hypothetical protein VMF06_13875 [Candidatus Limnocylindria bacterium]|jgi:hypothetical protein|nr:hypothetical protein [Candidatus Limnocylindria bacterium]